MEMQVIHQQGCLSVRTNIDMSVKVHQRHLEEGLTEYTFDLAWDEREAALPGSKVSLLWELPGLDVQVHVASGKPSAARPGLQLAVAYAIHADGLSAHGRHFQWRGR